MVGGDRRPDVGLSDLAAAGRTWALVLGLDHRIDVVEFELSLALGRARRSPVDLLGARPRVPAADRQEDPDHHQAAEHDECRELVHAGRVYAPGPCQKPSSWMRFARRSGATRGSSRPCVRTISPPTLSRRRSSAPVSTRPPWTRSTWAARTRRA